VRAASSPGRDLKYGAIIKIQEEAGPGNSSSRSGRELTTAVRALPVWWSNINAWMVLSLSLNRRPWSRSDFCRFWISSGASKWLLQVLDISHLFAMPWDSSRLNDGEHISSVLVPYSKVKLIHPGNLIPSIWDLEDPEWGDKSTKPFLLALAILVHNKVS
jgi:hypothetical protein